MKPQKKFLPEDKLIQALKNHDTFAMDAINCMYSEALSGVISRIVQKAELVEDILQETFAKIWMSSDMYDSTKGRFFTWILNVAKNQSIDFLRTKDYRNHKKLLDVDDPESLINRMPTTVYNPDRIGIKQLIDQLRPEYRHPLLLVYFEGYTHTETANTLELPLGTVKTRIRNGIIQLKTFFS